MKKMIMILAALVVTVSAVGQENKAKAVTTGLEKGLYVKFELGTSCNFERAFERIYDESYVERNEIFDLSAKQLKKEKSAHNLDWAKHTGVDVDAKLMIGYRFCPQFVIAGGIGGNMSTNSQTGTFSLPLFLHLRSDFIDAKVSPYAEINCGYAFMFNSALGSEEQAGASYELDCGNGNTKITNLIDYDIIKNGLFGELTLGVSFPVGISRMNVGVGCNISECFRGVILDSKDGYVRYGYAEAITPNARYNRYNWNDKAEEYELYDYYTYGTFSTGERTTENFINRFHSGVHLKIGFSF